MRLITLDKNYNIVCSWKKTRTGFRHFATLFKNNYEVATATAHYLNRTWESYEYETVIKEVLRNYFTSNELKKYKELV